MAEFQMRVVDKPVSASGRKRSETYQKAIDFACANPGKTCLVCESQCENAYERSKARNKWKFALQDLKGFTVQSRSVAPCGFQIYLTYTPPAEGA